MNHPLISAVAQTCYACPEQYEGQLVDGRFFYFRYRWGVATLGLGSTPDAAVGDTDEVSQRVDDEYIGVFDSDAQRDETFAGLLLMRCEVPA